jgi:hypothetical protein
MYVAATPRFLAFLRTWIAPPPIPEYRSDVACLTWKGIIMPSPITFARAARAHVAGTLVAGVLVAGFAGSSAARDAQIGAAALTLPAPQGFCELTEQQPADVRLFNVIGDLVSATKNELLAVSADCAQLEAWRAGKVATLDDYVQYQTPVDAMDSTATRGEAVKEICASARAEGGKSVAGATTDLNGRVDAAVKGAKFGETGFLGVLAEDADACYFGMLLKAHTEGGGAEESQLMISAATVVKGKVIFYNLSTIYHDAATVTAALARHRRSIPALLAANGG